MQSLRGLERTKKKEERTEKKQETRKHKHHYAIQKQKHSASSELLIDMCYLYDGCRTTMCDRKTQQNHNTVHRRIKPVPDYISQTNKSLDFQNSQSTIKTSPPLYLILIILIQQSNWEIKSMFLLMYYDILLKLLYNIFIKYSFINRRYIYIL